MNEPGKAIPSEAGTAGEAQSPTPDDGHVTPGTAAGAADLTENELEDVVGGASIFGGFTSSSGSASGRSGGGSDTLTGGGGVDSKMYRRTS
jgi:hypothetical protein